MSAQLQEMPRTRRMVPADLDAVVAIEREVFLFPWTRGNFSDSIDSGYHCLVLEQGGEIFGYGVMTIGAEEGHLLTTKYRRQDRNGKAGASDCCGNLFILPKSGWRGPCSWMCGSPTARLRDYTSGSDSSRSANAGVIIPPWEGAKIRW